jgi:hypothetical protein
MSAFSMKGLGRSIWSSVGDVAHGVIHPHASGHASPRGGSGSHVVDPATATGLFGHYAETRPVVGRPPKPMPHAEMAEFLDDGAAQEPAGVGRPPKPMPHAEMAEFLDDAPAQEPAGVGKAPKPMSRAELEYFVEDAPAKQPRVGRPPTSMSHAELADFLE